MFKIYPRFVSQLSLSYSQAYTMSYFYFEFYSIIFCMVKAMVFPVVMYWCVSWTHKEGWTPKNWCFLTVVLKKTLESPLDSKEIKPVNPKGNQPWIFIGRTDAEAEGPVLWPPDVKSWLFGKDPDAGKNWRQEEKWVTEDEMIGCLHWLSAHEFEQILGDRTGKPGVACCSPRVIKSQTQLSD